MESEQQDEQKHQWKPGKWIKRDHVLVEDQDGYANRVLQSYIIVRFLAAAVSFLCGVRRTVHLFDSGL